MRAAPAVHRQSGFTLLELLLRDAAMLTRWRYVTTTQLRQAQ
jgi:hypothetical protein